jgi:Leucine-rich repeat (LRR) protein
MKQLITIAAVVLVGCSKDTPETSQAAEAEPQVTPEPTPEPTPVSPADEKLIAHPIVERVVRNKFKKPEGELTEADLESVRSLSLSETQITDAGLKDVANLQKLTSLSLSNTKITDAGLKEVAKLQKLTRLSLSDTQITDAGLKDVAKLQRLKLLFLGGTKVTKAGVAEFKKALPNCTIYGP